MHIYQGERNLYIHKKTLSIDRCYIHSHTDVHTYEDKQCKIKPTGKSPSTIVSRVFFHLSRDESIISNTYATLTFKTNIQMKEATESKHMDSMT